jgi:hypothetical protein
MPKNDKKDEPTTTWDTSIHFGIGRQKGTGPTGFYKGKTVNLFDGILWRGDGRKPSDLFKVGFQPHKPGVKVSGRVTDNVIGVSPSDGTTRGGISMSRDILASAKWASVANKDSGWLYLVYVEAEEWAAEIEWNAKYYPSEVAKRAAKQQQEIMLLSVAPENVVAGRKIIADKAKGILASGTVELNKGYKGKDVLKLYKTQFGVRKFMDTPDGSVLTVTPDEIQDWSNQ